MTYDVIIIGGGPAGLTAAVYVGRAGLSALVIEKTVCGGQIINSSEVDNFPSRQHISGWQLADEWQKQAESFGVSFMFSEVEDIENGDGFKFVYTTSGVLEAKAVIISNGVNHRKLNCDGAEKYSGHGVSFCATCDGAFFREKSVAVVGGGNTAFEDAIYLASICKKVYIVNRRRIFRAEPIIVKNAEDRKNIELVIPYIPEKIEGDGEKISSFILKNSETGERRDLEVSGIFTAIGMIPDNERFNKVAKLDEYGYIIADENCRTSSSGVFAAGDTRVKSLRQLVTAASDGAIAANEAISYINGRT